MNCRAQSPQELFPAQLRNQQIYVLQCKGHATWLFPVLPCPLKMVQALQHEKEYDVYVTEHAQCSTKDSLCAYLQKLCQSKIQSEKVLPTFICNLLDICCCMHIDKWVSLCTLQVNRSILCFNLTPDLISHYSSGFIEKLSPMELLFERADLHPRQIRGLHTCSCQSKAKRSCVGAKRCLEHRLPYQGRDWLHRLSVPYRQMRICLRKRMCSWWQVRLIPLVRLSSVRDARLKAHPGSNAECTLAFPDSAKIDEIVTLIPSCCSFLTLQMGMSRWGWPNLEGKWEELLSPSEVLVCQSQSMVEWGGQLSGKLSQPFI